MRNNQATLDGTGTSGSGSEDHADAAALEQFNNDDNETSIKKPS